MLQNVRMGKLNKKISNPRAALPFRVFEPVHLQEQLKAKLEKPVKIIYQDGLIQEVLHDQADETWSMNIKRGILNLFQVNLHQQGQTDNSEDMKLTNTIASSQLGEAKFFRVMEKTLEGECETAYTVIDNTAGTEPTLNVTKAINFERCTKRPQIKYNWRFSNECPTCDPKYDDEESYLKSSTVVKYNITGDRNDFLIESAKAESQYTLVWYGEEGSVVNVYVNQTLHLYKAKPISNAIPQPTTSSQSKLTYSLDWDIMKEKFFMEADNLFNEKSPYSKVQDKPQLVKKLLKELVQTSQNSHQPISPEAPLMFSRIVKVLRMATKADLEKIHTQIYKNTPSEFQTEEVKFVRDILENAVALAGTEPAIEHIAQKIKNREIPTSHGASALRQLSTVRVVSKEAVQHIKDLCESEVVQSHEQLKKACFLTLGSLMRAACQSKPDKLAVESKNVHSRCTMQHKQDYSKYLSQKVKNAQNWEDKVLYLKALGNAALDFSIQDLEEIIENRDHYYAPYIRYEAILALRHVKELMPKKIQKVLMPIFMNTKEPPTVRQVAAYIILKSQPERPLLDMMAKKINIDRSRQVASFTWSLMDSMANSTNPCYKKLAADLKLALRLTRKIDPSILTHAKAKHWSFHDTERKVGLDVNLYSVMSNRSILPKTVSVSINANLFGAFKRDLFTASLNAEGLMPMLRHLVDRSGEYRQNLMQMLRRTRRSSEGDYRSQIRNIFEKLNIRHRNLDFNENDAKAYGYLRFMGQDFAFAPLDPQRIREYLEEGKLSFGDLERYLRSGLTFHSHHATILHETQYKIPTTVGLPLVIKNKIPVVMKAEGKIKADFDSESPLRDMAVSVDVKPSIAIKAIQSIEVWSPVVNTGVKVRGFISAFTPIKAKLAGALHKEPAHLKLSFEPPTSERQLLHVATQPVTYTREWSPQVNHYQEPEEKVVRGEEVNRQQMIKKSIDLPLLGTEFVARGHYVPKQWKKATPICPLSGPNKLIITARPATERSDKVELRLLGEYNRDAEEMLSTSLLRKQGWSESESNSESSEEIRREHSSPRHGKGQITLELTSGQNKATLELKARRSSEGRLHQFEAKIHRSSHNGRRPFELCLEGEALLPEEPFTSESVLQKKVAQRAELKWGESCNSNNFISFTATSERTQQQQWYEQNNMEEYHKCKANEQESPIACYEYLTEASKMTKYDIKIQYNNVPVVVKNITSKAFRALKTYYYWNTDVAKIAVRNPTNQIRATLRVDPWDPSRVNITVKTPSQNVTMRDLQLPFSAPRINVKMPMHKIMAQGLKFLPEHDRSFSPVCKVERGQIETFDGAEYASPLTTCWSVLAKDCSADEKFTVLVKKQTQDSHKKIVKILTHNHELKLKRESEQLVVFIDGQEISESEITPEMQRGNILIRKEGPYVTVKLQQEGVRVYFDGYSARVKLSPLYENLQCGLCGNMDREPDNEFAGPDNMEMSDRRDFFRQYTIEDQSECQFPTDLNQICRNEDCSTEQDDEIPESYPETNLPLRFRKSAEPIRLNRVVEKNGKTCFSKEPIPMCPENAHIQEGEQREVHYTCLEQNDYKTSEYAFAAERAPIPEVRSLQTSFTRTEMVAKTCKRYD
jgi:hypothetical protein